ncbi:MAG: DUF7409 domain-containing protein [Halodesulfurarchaeum sp.]
MTDIKFVGPATAPVLKAAEVAPEDIRKRRISHAQLVEAGVNPGVAAKIRRGHSLSWSLEGGEDLHRRAEQVRGLQDGEREWVAASAHDWEDSNSTGQTDREEPTVSQGWSRRPWPNQPNDDSDFTAEAEWRERSIPTPVSAIETLDRAQRNALAEAGITSVRRLATCDTAAVAASLDIEESLVRDWKAAAREMA